MDILTGFAVINDRNGKSITYTYDEVDENGNVKESNKKASYVVLDDTTKDAIETLEALIKLRLGE